MPKYQSRFDRRKIVAWDGEGANLPTGKHVYNLLANSRGLYLVNHIGLSTDECFQFMLGSSTGREINVVFVGSYDVNMILRDVPEDRLRGLWKEGRCTWNQYEIFYSHRKRFAVYENVHTKKRKRSFVLWDVFGYFQSSFVKACRKWLGEDFAGSLLVFDDIEAMKAKRSTFQVETIDSIIKYNYAECQLLVLLVEALFRSMDVAGISLQRYDGAGSIAASLLRKNNILMHKGAIPQEVSDWSQYAYSGGRIEPMMMGTQNVTVYREDINSAYPSASLHLPSYAGASWTFDNKWNGHEASIVEIEWSYRDERPFYPLWYRCPDGSIIYPRQGRGRYYGYEAQLLFDFFEEGRDFQVHKACNVELALDVKPFQFLRNAYAIRRVFKDQGSMAHEALKLGMNSVYGKLAQQAGYRGGRIPTYHHLLWAGQITSYTRALLYRIGAQHPTDVVAFATDAVISLGLHNVDHGPGLGQWSGEQFAGITLVQAGVYWLFDQEKQKWSDKYRGFDQGSLRREDVVKCWRDNVTYEARLTRFYGLGSAIGMNDFKEHWRVWRTEPRVLNVRPGGKRRAGPETCFADKLCATLPKENPYVDRLSTPYPLPWGLLAGQSMRPDVEGIDIRIIEQEEIDSYG